jgi:hypothetical protein
MINIEVMAVWCEEEGDGEPCDHCGEQRWNVQHKLYLKMEDDLIEYKPSIIVCDSCGEDL